ncbi:UDP-glycosyltransferase 74E2 [Linum perenne]
MEAADLPSFVTDLESYPGTLDLMLLNRMAAHSIRINPVGPTIPTAYLGKEESSKTTIEYGLSLFNQTGSQASITQWLDSKPLGSIIYASLGSLSDIPESQIVELANALHLSNHPFIWVVRASEQDKLPPNFTSSDLWRVGARANANITSEVVTRDEIRRGIKEVMEGESGEEIRRNVEKWKRSAHEAVADGGSSSRNINEFVTAIKNRG